VATNYDKTQQQQQHHFPQIFIPQNTPFENSTFCIPQSTPSHSEGMQENLPAQCKFHWSLYWSDV